MEGLYLKQSMYISDLLDKTQMIRAKPLFTPIASRPKFSAHKGELLNDPTEYRQVIGALQYCTLTRPDISYAVNQYANSCMLHENHTGLLPKGFFVT
jgi:hypothetical protein